MHVSASTARIVKLVKGWMKRKRKNTKKKKMMFMMTMMKMLMIAIRRVASELEPVLREVRDGSIDEDAVLGFRGVVQ